MPDTRAIRRLTVALAVAASLLPAPAARAVAVSQVALPSTSVPA